MEWKHIERQWAAMARRIRADARCANKDDLIITMPRGVIRSETAKNPVAGTMPAAGPDGAPKTVSTH
jgi:hypothetical protein